MRVNLTLIVLLSKCCFLNLSLSPAVFHSRIYPPRKRSDGQSLIKTTMTHFLRGSGSYAPTYVKPYLEHARVSQRQQWNLDLRTLIEMCFIIDRTIEMLTLNNFSVEIHGMIFVFKKTVSCIGIEVILGLGSSLQRLSFQTWQRLESDVRLIFWKCIRTNAILKSRWLLGTIR